MYGAVLVSFPSSMVAQLTDVKNDLAPLKFSIQNAGQIKSIMPNKKLILPTPLPNCPSNSYKFTVDRLGLANWLIDQQKTNPSTFYNTEVSELYDYNLLDHTIRIKRKLFASFVPPKLLET